METMKRKWGKPVTQVQVFTPQEYVAGCGESEVPALKADCGVGIEESPYSQNLAPMDGKNIYVRLTGESEGTTHLWYKCPQKHIVTLEDLKNNRMNVTWMGYTYPEYWHVDNPENFYGYITEDNGVHIFYIDLNNISGDIDKLPMS